jgi:hypothetical protein
MPMVLVPLNSHIFLQLWAAHFTMQNLLLYVCVCICTCTKLETWEHVRYWCHSLTSLPENTVAQYSASSQCNWYIIYTEVCYTLLLFITKFSQLPKHLERICCYLRTIWQIFQEFMYVQWNPLTTINLCCIVLILTVL